VAQPAASTAARAAQAQVNDGRRRMQADSGFLRGFSAIRRFHWRQSRENQATNTLPPTGAFMTKLLPTLVLALAAALPALAIAQSTCEAQAADKNLAGAAKASFVKKCNEEKMGPAQEKCEDQA